MNIPVGQMCVDCLHRPATRVKDGRFLCKICDDVPLPHEKLANALQQFAKKGVMAQDAVNKIIEAAKAKAEQTRSLETRPTTRVSLRRKLSPEAFDALVEKVAEKALERLETLLKRKQRESAKSVSVTIQDAATSRSLLRSNRDKNLKTLEHHKVIETINLNPDPTRLCAYCGASEEQTGRKHQRDHFVPLCVGGKDSKKFIACVQCNGAKQGRVFETVEDCKTWLHWRFWASPRARYEKHREFAFGGIAPSKEVAERAVELNNNTTAQPKKSKLLGTSPTCEPRHHPFIKSWGSRYSLTIGNKYAYQARDFKAIKELLKSTELTVEELIALAEQAWLGAIGRQHTPDKFVAKQCLTIHGFYHNFNQLYALLKPKQNTNEPMWDKERFYKKQDEK